MVAREEIRFINSLGEEVNLNQEGVIELLYGRKGAVMPPFSIVMEKVANRDGSEYRQSLAESSEVEIPLQVLGANAAELWQRIRSLRRILNPKLGLGRLITMTPDGVETELECVLSEMPMSEDDGNTFTHETATSIQRLMLVFAAPDPYWQSTSIQSKTFTTGQSSSFFPFFPLVLSSSQVFAEDTVDNTGDVEAYPLWTIVGPGSDILVRNKTTSKILSLSTSLERGETITIDTKRKTVVKNDGTNLFPDLQWGSDLWLLPTGLNTISIEMNNVTDESKVQLSYRLRYLGV